MPVIALLNNSLFFPFMCQHAKMSVEYIKFTLAACWHMLDNSSWLEFLTSLYAYMCLGP